VLHLHILTYIYLRVLHLHILTYIYLREDTRIKELGSMADVQGRYPELSVLTLNCWGIALLTPNRRQRVGALGAFIQSQSGSQLDLVLLQEVWVSADAAFLQECGQAAGLPFSVLFKSGLFGSGLLTLSRSVFLAF